MGVEIKKMDLESKGLVADRIEQLTALFPEIAIEGIASSVGEDCPITIVISPKP